MESLQIDIAGFVELTTGWRLFSAAIHHLSSSDVLDSPTI
jgi:hypothetical protein